MFAPGRSFVPVDERVGCVFLSLCKLRFINEIDHCRVAWAQGTLCIENQIGPMEE